MMDFCESPNKKTEREQHSQVNLLALTGANEAAKVTFQLMEQSQNNLGATVDWVRNNLGGSYYSTNPVSRLWSNVLSSDEGSEAVQRQLDYAQDILKRASNPSLGADGSYARGLIATDAVIKSTNGVAGYKIGTFRGGDLARSDD